MALIGSWEWISTLMVTSSSGLAEPLGVQGVNVLDQPSLHREHLAVLQLDAPFPVGGNGEYPRLESVPSHVFEEGRVFAAAHNVLVDAAGLVLVEELAFQLLPVHPHRELRDGRLLRQGEDVSALHLVARFVDEDLVHVSGSHLVLDSHLHPVVFDSQVGNLGDGDVGRWLGDNDTVGVRGSRRGHDQPQQRNCD